MVRNYMEIVVENLLRKVINHYTGICKCQNCLDDIKALTLNKFPPLYMRTKRGEAFYKAQLLSKQFEADVLRELTKAIEIVGSNPHHDGD